MKQIMLTVTDEQNRFLKDEAKERGLLTRQDAVRSLITETMKSKEKK